MKKGKDITIISYSRGLEIAFEVEEMLLKVNLGLVSVLIPKSSTRNCGNHSS